MSYDQVLSWIENALDGVRIETIKNSFDACGISHRRCDMFFKHELKNILNNSEYKNPIYREEMWDDTEILNLNFDSILVPDYGNREELLAEWDDLYPDSDQDDFLDSEVESEN